MHDGAFPRQQRRARRGLFFVLQSSNDLEKWGAPYRALADLPLMGINRESVQRLAAFRQVRRRLDAAR